MNSLLAHPYGYVALSLLLESVAAIGGYGTGTEGLQALARFSGRAGLLWFGLVFALAPVHRIRSTSWTRAAMRRRRQLGLAFGVHHIVHLALLLTYLTASGQQLDLSRAAGGAVGYFALGLMMLTSNDAAVARLGPKNWKRLHRVGLWYLWIVFLMTYVGRLQGTSVDAGGGTPEFVVCITFVLAIAGLRVVAPLLPQTAPLQSSKKNSES